MISFPIKGRKQELIKNLEAHAKADAFIQGTYFKDGKGCAVGCSLKDFGVDTGDHSAYEPLFGIPRAIAKLEDGIFEGLSVEDSKWWPLAFAKAVPEGKDLSLVIPKFLVWILEDVKQHAKEDGKKAIDTVIKLYERKIAGEDVDTEEWRIARRAAADAADAAAYAAAADADAADAAAYAAAADAAAADAAAYAAAADAAAYAAAADAADAARQTSRKKQALKLIEILEAE